MSNDRVRYNKTPVLEVGSWRIICPNDFGKKYRNATDPLLIHKCHKLLTSHSYPLEDKEQEREYWYEPDRSGGNPKCNVCEDPIPEEIQGLLALYYMDKDE